MAKFVNQLTLDTKGFAAGITEAVKLATRLPDTRSVKVTADTGDVSGKVQAVNAQINQISSKDIKITADTSAVNKSAQTLTDEFEKAAEAASGIGGNLDGVKNKINSASDGLKGAFSGVLGSVTAGGVAGVVNAIAGEAIGALKAVASEAIEQYRALDKNIANIATLGVEASGKSLEKFQSLIVDLSTKSPDTAANIADGVYNAISAGITGTEEEIVKFVETASQVAVAGLSDTNAAVNGLTSVVNAYGKGAEGAQEASNIFFAAIKAGKTTFNELNAGLAQVLPTASGLDINFQTLAGSIAKLTTVGIPTAQAASTLNAAFTELQKPGAELSKVLEAAGLDVSKMAEYLKDVDKGGIGFVGVLEKVKEGAAATGKTIGQAFSSSEAAKAIGALTKDLESTKAIVDGISADVADNVADKAFASASKSIDVNLGIIKNNFLAIGFDIIDIPKKIAAAFSSAFGGDGGGLSGIVDGIRVAFDLLRKIIGSVVDRIAAVFTVLGNIFGGIRDAIVEAIRPIKEALAPVVEAFSDLFGGAEDGVDIFGTLSNVTKFLADLIGKTLRKAIEFLTIPLKLAGQLVGFLITNVVEAIKWIRNIAVQAYEWITSFEAVQKVLRTVGQFVFDLVDKIRGLWDAVSGFLGLVDDGAKQTQETTKKTAEAVETTTDAVANNTQATDANTKAVKGNAKAGEDLQKQLADLAKQILEVQKARAKSAALFDASTIADDIERERKRLEIEKRFQDEAFAEELKAIKGNGAVAVKQRELINQKKFQADEEYQRKVLELERKTGEATLKALQEAAKQRNENAAALLDAQIKAADEQIKAGNLSANNAAKALDSRLQKLNNATAEAVRKIVESTAEFRKAESQIILDVKVGKIDAEEGIKQIAELRKRIEAQIRAVPGDSDLAQRIRLIEDDAKAQALKAAKEISDAIEKQRIALIENETLRKVEETVFALKQQRDLLLQNLDLTDLQRAGIIEDFEKKINAARNVAIKSAGDTLKSIGKKLGEVQFDFSGIATDKEAVEATKKQIADIREELRKGNLSFQEASKQLAELQVTGENVFSGIAKAIGKQTIKAAFKAATLAVEENLASVAKARELAAANEVEILKKAEADAQIVRDNAVLSEQQKADKIAEINKVATDKVAGEQEKAADATTGALESIGVAAGAQFAALIASGENAGDAIKKVAGSVAEQLLALYTPSIIGLFQSVIPPPFGLIAGGAAVAALQQLLRSALSGFRDGGYTGSGSPAQVAGVTHAREFVMPEQITMEHRRLFDHIYAKKPIAAFPALQKAMQAARIIGSGEAAAALQAQVDTVKIMPPAIDMSIAANLDRIASRLEAIPDESYAHHNHAVTVGFDARAERRYQRIMKVKYAR